VNTENEKVVRDLIYKAWAEWRKSPDALKFAQITGYEDATAFHQLFEAGYRAALQSQSNTDGWDFKVPEGTRRIEVIFYGADEIQFGSHAIESDGYAAAPKAPQKVSNTPQDGEMREKFERLISSKGIALDYRGDGIYGNHSVQLAWEALSELTQPKQQEQSREATLVYALRAARPFVVLCDNCGDEGRKETLKLIDAAIGNDSSPATPTATAPQESAPGQEAVAWIYAENAGKGREYITRAKPEWQNPQDLADAEVVITPLYLAPPTATAIAAMAIKQAANLVRESLGGRAGDMLASEILALTPAGAEAELEALTKIAKRYQILHEHFKFANYIDAHIDAAINMTDGEGEE
jgi:hypothetical protein